MSAVAVAPIVAPRTAYRAVSSRPARGARWGRVGPPARRAFSSPVDAPGGGASTSPAPPAVPPPRGEGSAAAALQAADSWRDVLAASTLVVLPDEESVAWQRQRIHRKRRAGGAARALGRIARWLAARDKLGAGGEREQCVNDARFARLVAAAAAPTTEGGAGGGGARVDDDDEEEEEESVRRHHPSPPSSSLTAEERAGDVADALEALRALGSLAPLPWVDERHPGDPVAMRPHVSRLIQIVASANHIAPHDATPAAWACDRLGLFGSTSETNETNGWDAATRRAGDVIKRAAEGLPFKILPDLATSSGTPRGEFGDSGISDLDFLDLDFSLTVEALAAEVPFRAEKLVTRDGKRVDERRETCWMAEDGIGGLAYSGKVMSPAPFTPTVRKLRDAIEASTGERFDCALLNLYPGGDVACKYHRDPDLGLLWARDSIIVSVGETRRFAFRELGKKEDEAHWFRLRSGDCVWMFANCNDDWEHCVMRAEGAAGENDGPRASVVFKRALTGRGGRRGHGMVGEGRRAGRKKNSGPARGSASGPDPIGVKSGGTGRGGRGGAARRRGRGGAGRGGGGRRGG